MEIFYLERASTRNSLSARRKRNLQLANRNVEETTLVDRVDIEDRF